MGDFSEEEVEKCLVDYLGTVTFPPEWRQLAPSPDPEAPYGIVKEPDATRRHQKVTAGDIPTNFFFSDTGLVCLLDTKSVALRVRE